MSQHGEHQHKPAPKREAAEQALKAAGRLTRHAIAQAADSSQERVTHWLRYWTARGEVAPDGFEECVKTRGRPSRILWAWRGAR